MKTIALLTLIATGHPAPGMPDPYADIRNEEGTLCCGGQDCEPLTGPIRYGPNGPEVLLGDTWVVAPPGSLGPSPDGEVHVCHWYIDGKPAIRCLLIPGAA